MTTATGSGEHPSQDLSQDASQEARRAPTPADVLEARPHVQAGVARTPTRRAPNLELRAPAAEIWIKVDSQTPSGSFKERGAFNALRLLSPEAAAKGVVAASAGNHARALAVHARALGVSAVIVMPSGTPHVKVEGTRERGARVVIEGDTVDEAVQAARDIAASEGRTFIHPFDDAGVIAGQGVAVLEFLEDAGPLDDLIVPIGGGGLMAGILLALDAYAQAQASQRAPIPRVWGAEPWMYPSMRASLGGIEPVTGGDTIAEGVAVKRPGGLTQAIIAARLTADDILLAHEAQIEEAVVAFALGEKLVVEGAGALGLAALKAHPEHFAGRRVGLLACGGNIDAGLFGQVLARHLVRQRRRARLRVECRDQPGRLAELTGLIHRLGVNVIDVQHDRLALDVPAKNTVIDVVIEADCGETTDLVLAALSERFAHAKIVSG